jgi:hypothetical protein
VTRAGWAVTAALGLVVAAVIGGYLVMVSALSSPVAREELLRVKSPDARVEAVLVRTNAGATTPYGFKVFIVPAGGRWEPGHENFAADHVEKLATSWQQDRLLVVEYREARIYRFSNFWQSRELDDWRYVVELKLAPLSPTFSLSERDR